MAEVISTLADASLMWLIVLSCIACLIPLAIMSGLVFGMHKILGFLLPVFQKGQTLTGKLSEGMDQFSVKASEPFIHASSSASRFKATVRGLAKQFIRRQT